jgi:hypothetical protein
VSTRAEVVAHGVASWLQFELLCDRGHLLSEASLSQPLGQLLVATGSRAVIPEEQHPALSDAWIDFVVKGTGGVITLAVETKWINGNRDMKQEILDDLVRLELVHTLNRQTGRWLLLAGEQRHLDAKVFNAAYNLGGGGGRVLFGPGVLPNASAAPLSIDIDGSQAPWRQAWKQTPNAPVVLPAVPEWPSGMKTKILAKYPPNAAPTDVTCMIWHVGRMQNRTRTSLP